MAEKRVVLGLRAKAPDLQILGEIAKWIARVGHAAAQAVTTSPSRIGRFSFAASLARAADALDAIGAFLHDAAGPNGHIGILLRLKTWRRGFVFLAVGVAEEVEAPDLIGAAPSQKRVPTQRL